MDCLDFDPCICMKKSFPLYIIIIYHSTYFDLRAVMDAKVSLEEVSVKIRTIIADLVEIVKSTRMEGINADDVD